MFFAARGLEVVGVDAVDAAVAAARAKARERGLAAEFLVHDALALGELGRRFRTVLDSGLFHTFDNAERRRLVEAAEPVVAYVIRVLTEGRNLDDPKVKTEVAAQVLPLIEYLRLSAALAEFRTNENRLARISASDAPTWRGWLSLIRWIASASPDLWRSRRALA